MPAGSLGFRRILMAAGGTGGHIFPALELGRALREADPSVVIEYCCGSRPGELQIYRSNGIEPIVLPATGRRSGILAQLQFLREMIASYRIAMKGVHRFQPDLAIGFGNYSSWPILSAARRMGAATALHEQNVVPGLANRWLGRYANLIMLGMPARDGLFPRGRIVLTGNPVRKDLLKPQDPKQARLTLGLPADKLIGLAFGGSLGAAAINRLTLNAAKSAASSGKWHFLWASGPRGFEEIRSTLERDPPLARSVTLLPFIDRMDLAYSAADLVLCRAGALTIAELTALGKPALLVPLPTSAGGHQLANARRLASAGAASLIEESDPEAEKKVQTSLRNFAEDCSILRRMGGASRGLGEADAAEKMVSALASLAWHTKSQS